MHGKALFSAPICSECLVNRKWSFFSKKLCKLIEFHNAGFLFVRKRTEMVTRLCKDIIKLKVNGENAAFDDRSFYFSDKRELRTFKFISF